MNENLIFKMWMWILFYRLRYVKLLEGVGVMEVVLVEKLDL